MHRSPFCLRALLLVPTLFSCAAYAADPVPKYSQRVEERASARLAPPNPFADPDADKEDMAPLGGPVVPLPSRNPSGQQGGRGSTKGAKTTVNANASTRPAGPTADNPPSPGQPYVPGVTYSGATADPAPGSGQAPAALGPAPYDLGKIKRVVVGGQTINETPLRVGNLDILVPMGEELDAVGGRVTQVDPKLTPGGTQGPTEERYFQINLADGSDPVVFTVGKSNALIASQDTPLRCAPLIIQNRIWLPVFSVAPLVGAATRLDTDGTLYLTPTVESVELFSVKDYLALTITTSRPVPEEGFKIGSLGGPDRLYFDFPGYSMGFDAGNSTFERVVSVGRGDVKRARAGMPSKFPDSTRVTLDLKKPLLAIRTETPYPNIFAVVLVPTTAATPVQQSPVQVVPPTEDVVTTASNTVPAGSLRGMTIVVDAGHGGHDTGARGSASREKDHTLDIAKRLAGHLRGRGAQVLMPRDTDIFISLNGRTTFANTRQADLFISIHINAAVNKRTQGTETYYWTAHSLPLAREIHKEFQAATGRPNRGVRTARFYVIRHTKMPSVLLETAFISNSAEEKLLLNPAWREKVAQGITRGVINYVNKYEKGLRG